MYFMSLLFLQHFCYVSSYDLLLIVEVVVVGVGVVEGLNATGAARVVLQAAAIPRPLAKETMFTHGFLMFNF